MEESWEVEWDNKAIKELKKLDKALQLKILDFFSNKNSNTRIAI